MAAAWNAVAETRRMDALERADDAWRTDQSATVTYYDKWLDEVGEEGRYLSVSFSKLKNRAGGLKLTCPRDMVHFDHFFNNPDGEDATIPITVETKAYRWDGYVTKASLLRSADGVETVDIEAIHCWNHVATTALWASPFAPILAQWPRHMVLVGPVEVLFVVYMSCNVTRQQSTAMPAKWYDAPKWVTGGGDGLWPIAIVPVDILTNTSKWGAGSARFDMADVFFEPMLDDSGVIVEAGFYLPAKGDEQPAPEWFWLDRNTVVLRTRDHTASVGLTGTLIDGLVRWFEDFIDDTSPERYPVFDAQTEYEAVYANYGPLGTKRGLPWVWYREGEYSGLGEAQVSIHKPTATHVIVGGKSPGWVNAGIELVMKNMLAWLGLLIGVPGLDALYQGQLDDVFLAWNIFEDVGRTQRAGPFAPKEFVATNSSKAFTLDGVMTGRAALHTTRGYVANSVTVGDGAPYLPGKDYDIGHQIGFEIGNGQIFSDYVTEMTYTDDRQGGGRWDIKIGDGSDEEDTLVKAWDRLGALATIVKSLSTDVGADLDLIIF